MSAPLEILPAAPREMVRAVPQSSDRTPSAAIAALSIFYALDALDALDAIGALSIAALSIGAER